MENYIKKAINAIENNDNIKKIKYLNKIIQNGGTVYEGIWKNEEFNGTVNGIGKTYNKNYWKNIKKEQDIVYLDKKAQYSEWGEDMSNKYKGTWVGIKKYDSGKWTDTGNWIESDNIYLNTLNEEFKKKMKANISGTTFSLSSLIKDSFYLHILFEPYIKNSKGGDPKKVFDEFLRYLIDFRNDEGALLLVNYFDNGQEDVDNVIEIETRFDRTRQEYDHSSKSYIDVTDPYEKYIYSPTYPIIKRNRLILTGYLNDNGGHSINIFIDDKNNIYIINSGEGIDYVMKELRYVSLGERQSPVIIIYKEVSDTEIKEIIGLCNLFQRLFSVKKSSQINNYFTEYDELFPFLVDTYRLNKYVINSKFLYLCIKNVITTHNIFEKFKEDKKQLTGSCSFFSTFYFIKYLLNFNESDNTFKKYYNHLITRSIERYCNTLYYDYIQQHTVSADSIEFYNNFLILIKDYNFDDKNNFLKIYENKIKNKNYSYISIPYPIRKINPGPGATLMNFSNLLNKSNSEYALEISFNILEVRYEADNHLYKVAKKLYLTKIMDILFKNIIEGKETDIRELRSIYTIIKSNTDKFNHYRKYIFCHTSNDILLFGSCCNFFKLFYIYLKLSQRFPTIKASLNQEQRTNLKTFITNLIHKSKYNNDYFFNYVDFYNYIENNFDNIEIVPENFEIRPIDQTMSPRMRHEDDYSFELRKTNERNKKVRWSWFLGQTYEQIFETTNLEGLSYNNDDYNGFEYILNIVNMINNDNIISEKTNIEKLIIFTNYAIKQHINLNDNNNDTDIFNLDMSSDIKDNFINLNLIQIIGQLNIQKYLDNKHNFEKEINEILICLIYCTDNAIYTYLISKQTEDDRLTGENDILSIVTSLFIKLNNIYESDKPILYTSLLSNIILRSDIDKSKEIFNIFYNIYSTTEEKKDFYTHDNPMFINYNYLQLYKHIKNGNELYYKKNIIKKIFFDPRTNNYYINIIKKNFNDILLTESNIDIYIDNTVITNNFLNDKLISSNTVDITFNDNGQTVFHILTDYDDIFFYFDGSNDNTYFQNSKNIYKVIFNTNDATLSMWVLCMSNGFILEDNDGVKYLLILINDGEYFTSRYINNIKKYHILKLHFTNLYIVNNDYDDMSALMLSLVISKNNTCQNLIYTHFYNLHLKNNENSVYKQYINILYTIDSTLYVYNDVPYWALFGKKINVYEYEERKEYLKINTTKNKKELFDMTELKKTDEYEICTKIIDIFDCPKIEINTLSPEYSNNEKVKNFLTDYRYKCTEITNLLYTDKNKTFYTNAHINLNAVKDNNYFITLISNDLNLEYTATDNIINKNKNLLLNISNIYTRYYLYFYKMLIKKIFNSIKKEFNINIGKNNKSILLVKIFEKLDYKIIYDFDQKRNISEIIFELQDELIIRRRQKTYIDKIILDLYGDNSDDNNKKPPNYNKIYQILMGIGKTSTITPILILNDYFKNKKNSKNIILPAHLINDSYNIMVKYSNVLYDFEINFNKIKFGKYLNILSDFSYKYHINKNFYYFTNINNYNKYIKNSLFILDEMDTLIDPLKSELNIPTNEKDKHIMHYKIAIIYIDKYLYEKSDPMNYDPDPNINKIIKEKITKINYYLKDNDFLKNYGFGNKNYDNVDDYFLFTDQNFYTAIPYKANDTPSNGSQYTDFELSVCLTIISYLRSKFRYEDIKLIFQEMNLLKNDKAIRDIKYSKLNDFINYDNLNHLNNHDDDKIQDLDNNSDKNDKFNEECKKIIMEIEKEENKDKKKDFLNVYLQLFILPKFFKIPLTQFTISAMDMVSSKFMNRRIAFSGTVTFHLPQDIITENLLGISVDKAITKVPDIIKNKMTQVQSRYSNIYDAVNTHYNEIIGDEYSNGAVEIAFNGLITTPTPELNTRYNISNEEEEYERKKKEIKKLKDGASPDMCDITDHTVTPSIVNKEKDLLKYVIDNIDTLNSVIDAAGIFLETKTNEILNDIYKIIASKNRKILFIDSDDNKKIYNGVDIKSSSKYNNEVFQDVFIYYDNKHCVGVDFKQPFIMKGLVTVSNKNTITEIAQAMYRLRGLNIGHTLEFYFPKNINNLKELFDVLNLNQVDYKNGTTNSAIMQCVNYLNCFYDYEKITYDRTIFYDLYKFNEDCLNNVEEKNKSIKNGKVFQESDFKYVTEFDYNNNKIKLIGKKLKISFKEIPKTDTSKLVVAVAVAEAQAQAQAQAQARAQRKSTIQRNTDFYIRSNCISPERYSYEQYFNMKNNLCTIDMCRYDTPTIPVYSINDYIIDGYSLKISLYSNMCIKNNIKVKFYFYIHIKYNYILIMEYRELFELMKRPNLLLEDFLIMDINGNIIYFDRSGDTSKKRIKRILPKIKLIFTKDRIDIKERFNTICGLYSIISNEQTANKIIYLLYFFKHFCMRDKDYYDFLFKERFLPTESYMIPCDEKLFKYTFFDSINEPEIIILINQYYRDSISKIGGGRYHKKYKIIKNM